MALKEVDFKTAVEEAGRASGSGSRSQQNARTNSQAANQLIQPAPTGPTPAWQARARQFIAWAQQNLNGNTGLKARDYLESERGLWPETWQHFGLGYNPSKSV